MATLETEFPYSLTISLPLPTHRLASAALSALQVDAELSPLVRRSFRLTRPQHPQHPQHPQPQQQAQAQAQSHSQSVSRTDSTTTTATNTASSTPNITTSRSLGAEKEHEEDGEEVEEDELTVLQTEYRATTNRMLRVAVNGFMESLGVVLGVMEELDVDVLAGELGQGGG
ncbi:hypothetical protein AJ78_02902 [Emergomyces pasteurianus Ep9510]|uniref:Uncharacterized protein n=1 Tax=Emergomyces pasteurianus Ep9510 TaxID=1447872 RepID=A0A1J9PKE2_9EURO|nr:hypothetical protein AJ78_02902 [Emergomyces pasteurianus Ep9510]